MPSIGSWTGCALAAARSRHEDRTSRPARWRGYVESIVTDQEVESTPTTISRRRTTLIAAAPLAISFLLNLGILMFTRPEVRWTEALAWLWRFTVFCAVGPLSRQFVLGGDSMELAMHGFALAFWTAYLLLIAKTRVGNIPWGVLFVAGGFWCYFGWFMGITSSMV